MDRSLVLECLDEGGDPQVYEIHVDDDEIGVESSPVVEVQIQVLLEIHALFVYNMQFYLLVSYFFVVGCCE